MAQTKVLFLSQEMSPYVPENARNLVGREMAAGLAERGYEVRTFMPKYGIINERRNQLHEVIRLSGLNIPIDDSDHPLVIKVATLLPMRMQVYFIDNDDFFTPGFTEGLETEAETELNDERMMFYARGVFETVKKLRWEPAVIQCDGWLTALAPIYVKKLYHDDPSFRHAKVVYTLRADAFDEPLDARLPAKLLQEKFTKTAIKPLSSAAGVTHEALSRLAIDYADAVVVADADVNPELVAYAEKKGKKMLVNDGSADAAPFGERLATFYATLLDTK